MTTTGTRTDTPRETASTAAEEAKHVGQVGAQEVQNVAAEAKDQVRTLLDETRTQLNDQTTQQRDRLVSTLQSFSTDLEDMAGSSQRSGLATELTRQAAQRARDLSDRLDGREPGELLDEVRAFARRRPGTFLLGAVVAGVVAGRLARGAKASAGAAGPEHPASVAANESATGWDTRVATTAPASEADVSRPAPDYSAPYAADNLAGAPRTTVGEESISAVRQDDPEGLRGQASSPSWGAP